MRWIAIGTCWLVLWTGTAFAEFHRFTAEYTEPTTNPDGSALNDLAMTRIYYDYIGDGLTDFTLDVPPMAVTGGGAISQDITHTFPAGVNLANVALLSVTVTAVDTLGNESSMFGPVTLQPLTIETVTPPPPTLPPPGTATIEAGHVCPLLDWTLLVSEFDTDGVGIDATGWRVYLRQTPSETVVSTTDTVLTIKVLFCVAPLAVDTYRYDVVPVGHDVVTLVESEGTPVPLLHLTVIPATTPPPITGDPIQVNFQPAMAATVAGYQLDSGQPFTTALGYGWVTTPGPATIDRNLLTNQLADTFVFVGGGSAAQWEYIVPNGSYFVTVSSGDALGPQGPHFVTVEGVAVINGVSTSLNQFATVTTVTPVVVSDGRMTVDIMGTTGNSLLNYLDLIPEGGSAPPGVPTPPIILHPPFNPFDPFGFGD